MDKRILKRYEDVYFVLAVILIYFLNAWDFQGFYDDSTKLDLISLPGFDPHNAKYIEKIRLTTFFLKYILKIGYWGFFAFLILFVISFLYLCKKLDVKRIYIYLSLLTLPTLIYCFLDYGFNSTYCFVYLIIIWMYYFYRIENYKMYYIFTIIGIFTREFCLYVNLFFLIESFFENCSYNLKEIWSKRKNISKVLNERKFEILAISGYLIYRLFFTLTAETNPLTYGSFRGEGLVSALMDIKNLFIL